MVYYNYNYNADGQWVYNNRYLIKVFEYLLTQHTFDNKEISNEANSILSEISSLKTFISILNIKERDSKTLQKIQELQLRIKELESKFVVDEDNEDNHLYHGYKQNLMLRMNWIKSSK